MRTLSTSLGLGAALAALVALTGCTTPPEPQREPLADLMPFVDHGVSTDIILPPYRDSLDLLEQGWEAQPAERAAEGGLWVEGRAGDFRFYSATAGAVTLEAEATTLSPPDAPQGVEVFLNGRSVHRASMSREWTRYEFPLPAADVRIGWNDVALRFDQAPRPMAADGKAQDPRRLAARFRRLRVRSELARSVWQERPAAVEVRSRDGVPLIAMPTDSVVTFHLLPESDEVLSGEIDVRPASPTSGSEILASAEIIDGSGEIHQMLVYQHALADGAQRFEIPLQPWVGDAVKLRLRSWGRDNGTVEWKDLALLTRPDASVADVIGPARLVVPPRSGRLGRPDVLLILLDAARADAFSHDAVPTPFADALAVDGTSFRGARAPAPWTGQSVPSMLTGRNPGATGAEVWRSPIPVDVPTLAERLGRVDYHTVVWSQHNLYGNNDSFRRGFDEFMEVRGTVADRARLPSADDLFVDGRPTFALIHLLPPHGPYRPPEPFDGSLSQWYTGDFPQSAASLNRASRPTGRKPTEDDVRYIRARYDENVRFADHLVGRLVQMFRDAGRYDDAVVIVTSEHGEGFFEHGRFLHTQQLYDEFLRIPLIIKWPQAQERFAADVQTPVGLVDIAPTLVDGLGLETPSPAFQGRTLLPLVFDDESLDRDLFIQTRGAERLDVTPQPVLAFVSGHQKVIWDEAAGTLETYDLLNERGTDRTMTGVDTAVHASEAGGASPLPTGTVETGESASPAVAGSFSEALAAQADDGRPSSFSGFAPDTSKNVIEDLGEETSESEASLIDVVGLVPEVVPETETSDVTPPMDSGVTKALLSALMGDGAAPATAAPPEVIPEVTAGKTGESLPVSAEGARETVLGAPTVVGPHGEQLRGSGRGGTRVESVHQRVSQLSRESVEARPSETLPLGRPSQPPGTSQPAANAAAEQLIPVAPTAPQIVGISRLAQDSGTPPAPDAATLSVASQATPRSEQGVGTTTRSSANADARPGPGPQPSHSTETTGPSAADVPTATTRNDGPTGVPATRAPAERPGRAQSVEPQPVQHVSYGSDVETSGNGVPDPASPVRAVKTVVPTLPQTELQTSDARDLSPGATQRGASERSTLGDVRSAAPATTPAGTVETPDADVPLQEKAILGRINLVGPSLKLEPQPVKVVGTRQTIPIMVDLPAADGTSTHSNMSLANPMGIAAAEGVHVSVPVGLGPAEASRYEEVARLLEESGQTAQEARASAAASTVRPLEAISDWTGTAVRSSSAPSALPLPEQLELPDQLVRGIRMQWRNGVGEAKLRLTPEHLGEVLVSLQVRQGAVSAVLRADSDIVRDWVRAHQHELKSALAAQGLELGELIVDEDGHAEQQPGQEFDHPRRRPPRQTSEARFEVRV